MPKAEKPDKVELRIGGKFVFSLAGLPPGYEFSIEVKNGEKGPEATLNLPEGERAAELSVSGPLNVGKLSTCIPAMEGAEFVAFIKSLRQLVDALDHRLQVVEQRAHKRYTISPIREEE